MIQRRASLRKRLIARAIERDLPQLLDELRWTVLRAEAKEQGRTLSEIDRSQRVSFARTVREHCPELVIQKVPVNKSTPIGILARCALYRLHTARELNQFLRGYEPTILCRFHGRLSMPEPRYEHRYVIPQRHAVTFRFFASPPAFGTCSYETAEGVPGTLIPATRSHSVSVVSARGGEIPVNGLAQVPWKLFGHDSLQEWFPVQPSDHLEVLIGRGPRRFPGSGFPDY